MRRATPPGPPPVGETAIAVAEAERAICRRVREQAHDWFPRVQRNPDVRLQPLSVRPKSRLYAVHLPDRSTEPSVLAKVRLQSGLVGQSRRPRLTTDSPSLEDLTAAEFAGLVTVYRAFGSLDDQRFGAVRPLDHLVEEHTILMDFVSAPTLRLRLVRQNRLSPTAWRPSVRPRPWANAGAWLRRYQEALPVVGFPTRQATRHQVLDMFDAYADFFQHRLRSTGVTGLVRDTRALAEQLLPEELPLAVGHGDFAPRNVFVDPDGRVTVFDPLPRWAVPSYEDICRFLVGMRLLGIQVHSHGAAQSRSELDRRTAEVLAGYSVVEPAELDALRCYELLILFDKWSAMLDQGGRGIGGRARSRSLELASGYVTHQARRLFEVAVRAA